MKQKRRTKRLMALALLLASVLGLAWASRITSVSVAGSDTQCVTIGDWQAFLPTATPGNSTEDQIYVDPLYEYRLRLAPDWRISPTPADALFGVATLYNYDPDEVEQSHSFPSDGLRIQIGVGPLKQGQSFNDWIVRRKADQTNSEYGVAVGLMVSESQSVQVGRYSGVVFIFQGRAGPPVLEIDLSHRNQVMSIGLLPANSTSLPDALAMLATLEMRGEQTQPAECEACEGIQATPERREALSPNVVSKLLSSVDSLADFTCPIGTFPGDEAPNSPIELWMPFQAGETWTVGGAGAFYGNWYHCNYYNDYYATDWNRSNDDGAAVLPVANGTISGYDDPPCPTTGYGCYVRVDHSSGVRTLYAHLSGVYRTSGSVNHWDQIGAVGSSGNSSGPHLHLTFRGNEGGYYSHCYNNGNVCPNGEQGIWPQSPKPSPMNTQGGSQTLQDGHSYTSNNQQSNDTTPPSNPTSIWSTSHSQWSWSTDNTIDVCWSGASDGGGSGVDGYSYEWSTSSTTIPDTSKDVEESTTCVTSPSLSDSNNWYFHIRTRDNAGNWNSGAAHYGPFYIDTTGPTIDFYSTPQTNHWYNTNQRVSWRISDGGSGWRGFSQNWDSDPGGTSPQFYTYEGFMDFSYIPETQRDGKHWAYVRAWDQVGNQRMERSGEYWYDATAPSNPSIIINDNATYTNNRNVSLALSASDPASGLSQMNLRNEGESWAGWRGYQSPYSWTLSSGDGTKTVYAQFKDAADNTSSTDSDDIILDTTPPDTTITSGLQGDIPVGDACFSWTGSDNITPTGDLVYRYRLQGSSDTWSDWDGGTTVCYSDLLNGDYTFEVKARDLAGNEDGTPASRSFFVDTTPPDTTITSGPSGCIGTNDVTFTWTGSDNRTPTDQLQYSYKLEGFDDWSAWTGDTSKSYTDLPDGDYTFKVKAQDGVGHEDPSPAAQCFRVDTTPPTGSVLINGGDSTTNKIAVHLDISGDDGPVGCGVTEIRLSNDGFNWEAWEPFATEGQWHLPTLNRTTWTVHLQLKDLVDNVSEAFTDDIYLDLYPPRPSSESYQLGARVVASGDPTSASESYGLLSATMGQPIADGRMQGADYRLESGYQGAWPSVPRGRPTPESYDINASLTASGGGYRISESYRLQSAMGQPTSVGPRSSENYQLLSGYLPCKLLGDLDINGRVDVADIMMVASRWRCQSGDDCYHERYDLDKDGIITVVDIMLVAAHWGETCE